jgi:N-formylglutamate amidohydrolase
MSDVVTLPGAWSGGSWPVAPFEIVSPRGTAVPVVAHVPHASVAIPDEVRAELVIDDAGLRGEVVRLTDWHTDELFAWLAGHGVTLFVNRLSRLVYDPERFLDDSLEPAAAVGQGVVYVRGSLGQPLRDVDAARRARRIEQLYQPYHAALDAVVEGMLRRAGVCTILDCHSFPSQPLPSELDQAADRPEICIGTDAVHTPPSLAEAVRSAFASEGFVTKPDSPFSGAFVPVGHASDERVRSVMIEVRRSLYVDEATTQRGSGYEALQAAIERAIVRAGIL